MIRPLGAGDREAAALLWEACGLTRPWNDPRDDFDRALAGPSSAVLGAFDGVALAGTVMVGSDGHRGWLYYLAVEPGQRLAGLGRTLVAAAEAWLAAHDMPVVRLMVCDGNDEAAAFWAALGYTRADVAVLGRRLS